MSVLIKPEPFSSEMNRFLNTFFGPSEGEAAQRWVPAMDLVEAEDHFVLRADLPGLGTDDVNIEVRDNTLTISGERTAETTHQDRGFYRVERSFGRFSRSVSLPEGVDPDAVTASFNNGVLEVRIPKPELRKPRRIAITGAEGEQRPPQVEGTAAERPAAEGGAPEAAAPASNGSESSAQHATA